MAGLFQLMGFVIATKSHAELDTDSICVKVSAGEQKSDLASALANQI